MGDLGRGLVALGAILMVVGGALVLAPRLPWLGRLPGDIIVRREHVTIYLPIVTSLVASIVLTILVNLFWRR